MVHFHLRRRRIKVVAAIEEKSQLGADDPRHVRPEEFAQEPTDLLQVRRDEIAAAGIAFVATPEHAVAQVAAIRVRHARAVFYVQRQLVSRPQGVQIDDREIVVVAIPERLFARVAYEHHAVAAVMVDLGDELQKADG